MDDRTGSDLSTRADDGTRERLLRTLFDKLPAMIAYWDDRGCNVTANEAYVEWFGYHPDDMVGLHISEVLGAAVYAKNLPYIHGVLAGEEQLFERTLVDQSGRTRHTQASYVPDVVDGAVRGFFVLVTDVTPRVEAQQAMDEAQALAHLGSWTLTPGTGELTWTRELFNIVGLDPAHGTPTLTTLSEHIHPDDRNRVLSTIDRATRTGEPYVSEYRIIRSDGTQREVVSHGRPVTVGAGAVVRVTGTLQDITESNAVSRDLARMNAELRQANELNADVIAMLGHDIRTPLTAIRGFAELLGDGTVEDPADRHAMASQMRAATERLLAMVERILSLAAIDSGTITASTEVIDLADALPDMVGVAGGVTLDLDPATPTVRFDRVHLEQIVDNLVANARRYGALPVLVCTRTCSGAVEVAVSDAGPGVPEEIQSKLFTRFARTGEDQVRARGTGFGLYMAAQLAAANDARLTYVPASPGRPHEFRLRIGSSVLTEAETHL